MTTDAPRVTDPATIAAMSKCLLARVWTDQAKRGTALLDLDPRSFHPRPCEWESWPPEHLSELVNEHNAFAQDEDGEWAGYEVRQFRQLPPREQRRQVYVAQYGEEPIRPTAPQQEGS